MYDKSTFIIRIKFCQIKVIATMMKKYDESIKKITIQTGFGNIPTILLEP